ncbi:SnoaL-like polyketide cyclase [Musa troglodytarum]|uniref:SnoaL-like polyketide cyclase n=1 Tax=Musa troglodytarum TaxID=320322 RepID=A0A9E7I533_9LILI|nr:SnoaL-like polyketide cyclase [Musa troglodytarum]
MWEVRGSKMIATAFHFGAIPTLIPVNNLARVSKEGRRGPSTTPPSSAGPVFRSGSRISRAPATAPIARAAAEVQTTEDALMKVSTAADVVREFYDGINRRDLSAVEPLISEGCVYEDLVFPRPFVGRKAILDFFKKFTESFSADLQFVIDDMSNEDSSAVGVTWHLEWRGRPFPFSKGCSFYSLQVREGKRQIVYVPFCKTQLCLKVRYEKLKGSFYRKVHSN